ncbi:MAG: S41 family peptidase [Prevotellaceae bacterium]|nr:S41 family peptidase [Prevotellaceae bacterium]
MKRLLYLIFILIGVTSCVDEENLSNTPEGNFEALWSIIDERYCFFDYKAETLGLDWDEVHARYRARLSDGMTSEQLFEVLTDMLSELHDGHVNLYSAGNVARYWSWFEDYPKNWDAELRAAYLGTDYRLASGLAYKILDDNTGYVVCESFSSAIGEGNISEMLYYLRTTNGLILDVRGNTGGELTYAERLASHFTNERILVGYTTYKTGTGHSDFAPAQEEWLEPSQGVRWQKPVVVLTNRECYSACNLFARDIRECPGVTVLGDQTGGGSGMPFTSELPNGWAVRYSASPSFDARMNQIEFGIEPDIPCQLDSVAALQGYDSLIETARELLR